MHLSNDSFARTWREFHESQGPGLRQSLRSLIARALGRTTQLTGWGPAALRIPRVHALILHHVFPDEEQGWRNLLRLLSRDHSFISYSEAVERIQSNRIDKPYLTITFDDGFKNCMAAARIMNEFGARGCFFICPTIINETNSAAIQAFCRNRLLLPGKPVEFMTWQDCEELIKHGHEIGGHTMTHANLGAVSQSQANDEIAGSLTALQARVGNVTHFAWTFGQFENCTPAAVRTVFDVGYRSCASGVRGCHVRGIAPVQVPVCIRREHTIAGAPLSQARFFIGRSARSRAIDDHGWPAGWAPPAFPASG